MDQLTQSQPNDVDSEQLSYTFGFLIVIMIVIPVFWPYALYYYFATRSFVSVLTPVGLETRGGKAYEWKDLLKVTRSQDGHGNCTGLRMKFTDGSAGVNLILVDKPYLAARTIWEHGQEKMKRSHLEDLEYQLSKWESQLQGEK